MTGVQTCALPISHERYYAAALRHLTAWQQSRTQRDHNLAFDSESDLNHLAHAAACLIFLLWFDRQEMCGGPEDALAADRKGQPATDKHTEAPNTPETDAEFADELRTLRDLGIIQEITSQVKFASEDRDALDRLSVRDVPEIELKATKALAKGKDRFRVKGVRFVRVS